MKLIKPALAAATIVSALAAPLTASAGPTVGLDVTGTGTYTTYADLWTNVTDTALSTSFVPGRIIGPGASAPYLTELRSQMAAMADALPAADCPPPSPGTWCPPVEGGDPRCSS